MLLDAGGVFFVVDERGRGVINPDVLRFIDGHRDTYLFAMVSDTSLDLQNVMELFGIRDRFALITTTGQEGIGKDSPEFFARVARKLGVAPRDCILIDNTPEFCAAARTAGMQSILYERGMDLAHEMMPYDIMNG